MLNTISRKVFVGYAAILLIQLVSALTLFYKLENINKANDEFVEKSLPTLQAVKQTSSALNHMLIGAYGLYGYTLSLEEFETIQQDQYSKLSKLMPKVASHVSSSSIDINGFQEQLTALASVMSSDEVDWDRARGLLTALQAQSAAIEATLLSAEKSVSRQANDKVEYISTDIDVIIIWLVAGLLLASAIIISAFVFARKTIVSPVKSLSRELDKMVETQDLRKDVGIQTKDEIGIAGRSINKLLQAYRKVNGDINETGLVLQDSIGLLNHSAELSEQEIENLRAIVDSLLMEISSLEARISDAASRSESASGQAFTGAEQVAVGSENITNTAKLVDTLSNDIETSAQMLESLKQSGDKVSSVVKTIADIAEQTNLLALNAAIEAARAGESGRGFAVVAGEVRALASRTHDSTHEINSILEEIVGSISATVSTMEANQLKAGEAVGAAEETVESLQQIKQTVLGLSEVNHELADLGQASQAEVGKMRDYVDNINEAVATVTTTSGETRQASQSLNDLGGRLNQVLQQFRT